MGFRQATIGKDGKLVGGYARVWEIAERNGFVTGNVSISKKPKDSDKYVTDFQDGYVSFFGSAAEKIKGVQIPEKRGVGIQIKSCDCTNKFDPAKNKKYENHIIYDFDFTDSSTGKATTSKPNSDKFVPVPDGIEEELPFN